MNLYWCHLRTANTDPVAKHKERWCPQPDKDPKPLCMSPIIRLECEPDGYRCHNRGEPRHQPHPHQHSAYAV